MCPKIPKAPSQKRRNGSKGRRGGNNNRYIKIRIHFLPISSGSIIHLKKEFFHQDNNDK